MFNILGITHRFIQGPLKRKDNTSKTKWVVHFIHNQQNWNSNAGKEQPFLNFIGKNKTCFLNIYEMGCGSGSVWIRPVIKVSQGRILVREFFFFLFGHVLPGQPPRVRMIELDSNFFTNKNQVKLAFLLISKRRRIGCHWVVDAEILISESDMSSYYAFVALKCQDVYRFYNKMPYKIK